MKDTNYFTIQSWMVTKLGLKGADRDVFAIIFGFTQDNDTECKCGYKYMMEITGYSKPTIIDAIDKLISQDLILKIKSDSNNDMRNHYKCNHELVDSILTDEGGKATLPPLVKPLNPPSKEALPHNISENINNKLRKAPAEPTLSSSTKSRKRDLISRSKTTLVDDLESGKDIAEQKKAKKKSPKELFRDECLEIIEHEYSDSTADLLTDYFNFISDPKQANSDNKMKVVKTVSTWKKKLDRLEELVKEGYDCEKLIKQSLRNKNYVFYPLESVDKNSQYNNQSNKYETCDVIPTQMTHEEILAEKQRLIDAGAKVY